MDSWSHREAREEGVTPEDYAKMVLVRAGADSDWNADKAIPLFASVIREAEARGLEEGAKIVSDMKDDGEPNGMGSHEADGWASGLADAEYSIRAAAARRRGER
jgi:hypothetical protein